MHRLRDPHTHLEPAPLLGYREPRGVLESLSGARCVPGCSVRAAVSGQRALLSCPGVHSSISYLQMCTCLLSADVSSHSAYLQVFIHHVSLASSYFQMCTQVCAEPPPTSRCASTCTLIHLLPPDVCSTVSRCLQMCIQI